MPFIDGGTLTDSQRQLLESFEAVTSTASETRGDEGAVQRQRRRRRRAINLLEKTGWNVETAIARVFDGDEDLDRDDAGLDDSGDEGSGNLQSRFRTGQDDESRRPLMDTFGIDDSATVVVPSDASGARRRGPVGPRGSNGGPAYWIRQLFVLPLNLLAWPAGILYGAAGLVLGFIARILRIRPGPTSSLRPRNPFARDSTAGDGSSASSRRRLHSPSHEAERWIRSVEELTGAVRWSRRFEDRESEGVASATPAGSGTAERRTATARSGHRDSTGRRTLPDFFVDGYEAAVRRAKDDIKVLMVVLTCDEHQDDEEFKRTVLTDPELAQTLSNQGVLVWGGDVRQRDAYTAGRVLQYYALPFVAFISLQPPSSASGARASSPGSPRMTVISRLEGSPSTTTSAASICTHLTTVVMPRVSPFLARQRAQQATRLAERRLREEQDRAYAAAARQDEARVLKMRAEQAQRLALERERQESEARAAKLRQGAKEWRAWQRAVLEREGEPEQVNGGAGGVARVGVRLGDGRRVVRRFRPDSSTERVYAFVECALEEDDGERSSSPPSDYKHEYAFTLATTFPRQVLELSSDISVAQVGWLAPNASLVVEGLAERRVSFGESAASDEEEEEDDEEGQ